MDKADLRSSAEKIKRMRSKAMEKVRPAPRRTGPLWFLAGLAGGLAALFFFDSRRGAARRQMVVDQFVARTNDLREMSGKKARHWRNKTAGMVAERRPDVAENLADTGTAGPQT